LALLQKSEAGNEKVYPRPYLLAIQARRFMAFSFQKSKGYPMKAASFEILKVCLIVVVMTITSHFLDCYFNSDRSCSFSMSDGRITHEFIGKLVVNN
jgi:hypothetical protein